MGERWNPWRALRERARTVLEWQRLEGDHACVEVRADGTEVITLDPRLGRRDRTYAVGHEVTHLERGLLPPGTPAAVVQREEHQVAHVTARRLVPLDELATFVAEVTGRDEAVTARSVADAFDVPTRVAERALAAMRHPLSRVDRSSIDEEGAA